MVPVLVYSIIATSAMEPESIDLIQEPSKDDILSDVYPTTNDGGSDLDETFPRWEVGDCLSVAAK